MAKATPTENGVSDELSPVTLITGEATEDYEEIMKLNFGDYVQVHNSKNRMNTNEAQMLGAIASYLSGNRQGGWQFISLVTGGWIHRYQWTQLPASQDVIKRVNELVEAEGQHIVVVSNFKYKWIPGQDMEEEYDYKNDEEDEVDEVHLDQFEIDDQAPGLMQGEEIPEEKEQRTQNANEDEKATIEEVEGALEDDQGEQENDTGR